MDFIERIFGVSPDAGSGSFEALLFALAALAVTALWRARRRGSHRTGLSGTDGPRASTLR